MGRGTRRGYASALAGGLVALAVTAGCGTEPAAYVGPPTATSASAGPAVTAPPGADPVLPQPVFTAAAAQTQAPEPLTIEIAPASRGAVAAGSPTVVQALIPFPASRQREMAAYSLRHYGTAAWQLTPTMIVLHYTAGGTAASTRAAFAADIVNLGELPGTCSHYLVDQDGTVYQLVPTSIRCRHTIGLNDQAIGIEMVQDGGPSATWADRQILDRPAQIGAALALVRQLQAQFGIATTNVIGHAMANAAPQFHDLLRWHNDHADWAAADVAVFRSRL